MRLPFALFLMLIAGSAAAQKATDELFDSLDLDGDGYVSIAEAAGNEPVVTRFDRGDRNRDGKLSRKEFHRLKRVRVRSAAAGRTKAKAKKKPGAAAGG